MERLYSGRFALGADGEPRVTVGVMTQQEQIAFSCRYGCDAILYQRDGRVERVKLEAGYAYQMRRLSGKAGWSRYWLTGFSAPWREEAAFLRLRKAWEAKSFAIHPLETGGVFSLGGELFDTRRRLGSLAVFADRKEAERKAALLADQLQHPIRLHEEIARRPSIRMVLMGGGRMEADDLVEIRAQKGLVRVERVEFGRGERWHRFATRHFGGRLFFTADREGKLALIHEVRVSDYLRGVLRAEMPPQAPKEALKAQAVCARNEILAKMATRHRADPYLFCADTHCQVYTGVSPQDTRIDAAIRETRGIVMTLPDGQMTDAPFSAVSGGHTENNEHVWADLPRPALRGKPDLLTPAPAFQKGIREADLSRWLLQPPAAYGQGEQAAIRKRFRWVRSFRSHEMDAMIQQYAPVGHVKELIAEKRGVSGRIYALRIVGMQRTVRLYGELKIRRLLGNLSSSMFLIQREARNDGQPADWKLIGGGWGHGVGLCQYGAIGRARAGQSFRMILQHYFTGIRLRKLY
jgi:SpoIID/LytB domain protein